MTPDFELCQHTYLLAVVGEKSVQFCSVQCSEGYSRGREKNNHPTTNIQLLSEIVLQNFKVEHKPCEGRQAEEKKSGVCGGERLATATWQGWLETKPQRKGSPGGGGGTKPEKQERTSGNWGGGGESKQ